MNKNPDTSGLKPAMTSDNQPAKRGRPAGSPNKNNLVRAYIENNFPGGFEGYMANLLVTIAEIEDPAKKVKNYIDLMPYMAATLKQIDATLSVDQNGNRLMVVFADPNASKLAGSSEPKKPDIEG